MYVTQTVSLEYLCPEGYMIKCQTRMSMILAQVYSHVKVYRIPHGYLR